MDCRISLASLTLTDPYYTSNKSTEAGSKVRTFGVVS